MHSLNEGYNYNTHTHTHKIQNKTEQNDEAHWTFWDGNIDKIEFKIACELQLKLNDFDSQESTIVVFCNSNILGTEFYFVIYRRCLPNYIKPILTANCIAMMYNANDVM